MDKIW